MNAENLKIGDPVYVDCIDGFGGPAIVIDVRESATNRCKVLMDDGNPAAPFWAHNFELEREPQPARNPSDLRPETLDHIVLVRRLIGRAIDNLKARQEAHDLSKLRSPEREAFDEFTPKLAASTYGSEEYYGFLSAMKPALDHHYAANSHHPEHYRWHCPVCSLQIDDDRAKVAPEGPNESGVKYCPRCCRNGMIYESELVLRPELGIRGMSLLDILEMLCDWKAATLRHADGDLLKSIEINQRRFGYTDELKSILVVTAKELGLTNRGE